MKGPPFTPRPFGRFHLVERLATGGMAEIFKAKSRSVHGFEKTLVIKRILPHLAEDREFVDMFIDEAKLMVQLEHPKIVQVLDFGEIDGHYYIALEHVDGIDGLALLRRCAKRRVRPTTGIVLHIVAEVLDALDFAHALRGPDDTPLDVVHRDISPSNIFISRLGEVKLGDFGIARAALRRGNTEGGALKGKYGYMAPEQATGSAVDRRADIFAVGVVLSELLMIRRLFFARNDLEILLQVRDARLDRLDRYGARIPADLRSIIESALSRDPQLRFQTAAAFRDALHRYLFEQRRMVRDADVRTFVQRLTESDEPMDAADKVEAIEITAEAPPAPAGSAEPRPDPEDWPRPVSVGRKRRIIITPPPMPLPLPSDLGQGSSGEKLDTAQALAAVPEMELMGSLSRFDLSEVEDEEDEAASRPPGAPVSATHAEAGIVARRLGRPQQRRGAPSAMGRIEGPTILGVIFSMAVEEVTGLLVVEHREVCKEIYLVDGDPQFVTSNQGEELFGQYLVVRGIISAGELSMALAMLPHFNGRLGDTLVGLKLLRPVQVLRHLTNQVRQKLLDVFAWENGEYRFYPGETCEKPAAPLGLDAFEIIGAAVRAVPRAKVEQRLRELASCRLATVVVAPVPPEVFRLGGMARRVADKLDGRRTVGELLADFDDGEERLLFGRVVLLLRDAGLARPQGGAG